MDMKLIALNRKIEKKIVLKRKRWDVKLWERVNVEGLRMMREELAANRKNAEKIV